MTYALDVDRYWLSLDEALPVFTEDEQVAAIALYRELAKGAAVTPHQLAGALGVTSVETEALLSRPSIRALSYLDDDGGVLGFGGLAAAPMAHRLQIDGRTLWTWCAWDSLFIPEILGEEARVESRDPRTGNMIRLTVGPDGVRASEPEAPVVSFVAADAEQFNRSAENVMGSFCHFVFFFESRASGEAWTAENAGTFILSLDEAAELAHRLNRRTWGEALESRASGPARGRG